MLSHAHNKKNRKGDWINQFISNIIIIETLGWISIPEDVIKMFTPINVWLVCTQRELLASTFFALIINENNNDRFIYQLSRNRA